MPGTGRGRATVNPGKRLQGAGSKIWGGVTGRLAATRRVSSLPYVWR